MIKNIFFTIAFACLASFAFAQCKLPNCFGVIGYDPQTGQKSTHVDYSDLNEAARAVRQECPNCELAWFKETCAVMVYSLSHKFMVFQTAWYKDTAGRDAINECHAKIKQIGLGKMGDDRRRSRRQHGEKGTCEIVHQACTKLPI